LTDEVIVVYPSVETYNLHEANVEFHQVLNVGCIGPCLEGIVLLFVAVGADMQGSC
jgi:hypothetical protein